MSQSLRGQKVAVLVANGFCEKDLTVLQKEILHSGAQIRIVSMDAGLVNSWDDESTPGGWGLNFAADAVLSRALAADYDMLVVPGGVRNIEKLQLTAHTRRFIRGFVEAGKAVVFYNNAVGLLRFAECEGDFELASAEAPIVQSGHVLSGVCDAQTRGEFIRAAAEFLSLQALAAKEPQAVAA
ncbi:MAG: DJ-1/PfpI family protein [Rhodospirillales bacterium]|nr:DJ-1/PfpI family protein [Rhodospirillales bacterium]